MTGFEKEDQAMKLTRKKGANRTPVNTPAGAREANTAAKKLAMIAAIGETGTVRAAVAKVGIGRTIHYEWMNSDAEYAENFGYACEERADILEAEAFRRGHDGIEKPVFWHGV